MASSNNTYKFSQIKTTYGGSIPIKISTYRNLIGLPSTGPVKVATTLNTNSSVLQPILLYDASNTANNGVDIGLTTWTNRGSLSNMDATARFLTAGGSNPRLRNVAGRSYIEFNRTEQQYLTVPSFTADIPSWGGLTTFVVSQMNSPGGTGYERLYDFGNGEFSSNYWFGRMGVSSNMVGEVLNGATPYPAHPNTQVATDGNWHVWAVRANNTSLSSSRFRIYRDTGTTASLDVTNSVAYTSRTTASNNIGRSNWAVDAFLQGNIGEIRFYKTGFTSTTGVDTQSAFANIMTGLKAKWGV